MGQQQKTTWIGFIRHFGAEVSLTKSWAPALGFKLGAPDGDTIICVPFFLDLMNSYDASVNFS